ncbi:MAG TPA: LuxR C-terminal-related transcriptional regulator [Acidimicrobiales bacterium]|nr:LuxR C-terminal-related transcriptional regulator [Acidimicrobiales bacterium]
MARGVQGTHEGGWSKQQRPKDLPGAHGVIVRNHLLATLDQAVTHQVTVISAPPGSGKTWLLRAWAERAQSSHRVAFVTVERDQRDPQQFWLSVRGAIRRSIADVVTPAEPATPAFDGPAMVDKILIDLADRPDPVVLILDDLHELHSEEALVQLEHLLSRVPSSACVVLSARRDPRIRLHQLRLVGQVANIRAGDLVFSVDETQELLRASGITLSAADAAMLHRRTEGWAAGLRLAAISLEAHPDPVRFVAEFSGTDRAIGEYLIAEMLERQPDDVRNMLLRTSLLDRVNGELADLLSGRPGCERFLLELEDANAFVVSLDARRTWFRYHQLLADFLHLELRRTAPDAVPDLHRRAAGWLLKHGEVVEAVRHTQSAGDSSHAAQLLTDHLFSLTLDGQEATIAALLRSFPPGTAAHDPELALAHAAVQLSQGLLEEAAAHLARAESHFERIPSARRRRQAMAIASLRLALARRSGQFTEVVEQVYVLDASVAEANELTAIGSELWAVALMNLGIVETWTGRLADAERHLSQGAALAQAIGRPYLEVVCRAHLGFPSDRVSCETAHERGQYAVALAEHHGWGGHPIIAPALGALAGVTVWMGEFDEAERWLRRANEIDQGGIDPSALVLLHVTTGMLHAARGQHREALDAFEGAAQSQSLLDGMHVLATRIAGWQAATQARLGMPDAARASLALLPKDQERMGDISNAHAVICLAEKEPAMALDALRDVLNGATPNVPPFTLVETHLLAATANMDLGARNAAAAALEAALAAAEPEGLIFPFAMIATPELLDAVPRHETAHGGLVSHIVDVLGGSRSAGTHKSTNGGLPTDDLSPRELRVLRYLPTNMTRSEVARELCVSVNTVNTHVRNIYSKLGVGDRSAAVQRARELRLLSNGL